MADNLPKLSKKILNSYIKKLPVPIVNHLKRCKLLATFFTENLCLEDWFIKMDIKAAVFKDCCYYHDIGKALLDKDHLYITEKSTKKDTGIYETHVDEGLRIILEQLDESIIDTAYDKKFESYLYHAIKEHHKRYNGEGFPKDKTKEKTKLSFMGEFVGFIDYIDNNLFMGIKEDQIDDFINQLLINENELFSPVFISRMLKNVDTFKSYCHDIFDKDHKRPLSSKYGLVPFFNQIINFKTGVVLGYNLKYYINNPYYGQVEHSLIDDFIEQRSIVTKFDNTIINRFILFNQNLVKKEASIPMTFIRLSKKALLSKNFVGRLLKKFEEGQVPLNNLCLIFKLTNNDEITKEFLEAIIALKQAGVSIGLAGVVENNLPMNVFENIEFDYLFIDGFKYANTNPNSKQFSILVGYVDLIKSLGPILVCENVNDELTQSNMNVLGVRNHSGKLYINHQSEFKMTKTIIRGMLDGREQQA